MRHPGELISAYLDGELHGEEARELFKHLGSCGKCSEEMHQIQDVRAAVRSLPILEVPEGLTPTRSADVVPIHRNRGVLVGAAAAIAIFIIAIAALVTPAPATISVDELNSRFAARVSLDPAFGPAKVILPDNVEIAE